MTTGPHKVHWGYFDPDEDRKGQLYPLDAQPGELWKANLVFKRRAKFMEHQGIRGRRIIAIPFDTFRQANEQRRVKICELCLYYGVMVTPEAVICEKCVTWK
jgi:hypothetical protein